MTDIRSEWAKFAVRPLEFWTTYTPSAKEMTMPTAVMCPIQRSGDWLNLDQSIGGESRRPWRSKSVTVGLLLTTGPAQHVTGRRYDLLNVAGVVQRQCLMTTGRSAGANCAHFDDPAPRRLQGVM